MTFYATLKGIQQGKPNACALALASEHVDVSDYPRLGAIAKKREQEPATVLLHVLRAGDAAADPELYADCYLLLDAWVLRYHARGVTP